MDLMPQGEEQAWLVLALKRLINTCGWRRFVRAPILEPTPLFFPEASGDSELLIDRTARRLLHYAGAGDVEVELEVTYPDDDVEKRESPIWLVNADDTFGKDLANDDRLFNGDDRHIAGDDRRIAGDDRRVVIGVRADFSPDAEDVAGALSHVVAQIFRRRHGLAAGEASDERLEVEVTSVYLGFGILAANSALRYQSGADLTAGWAVTTWQITSFGVLTPQALTYLLALQCSARRLDKRRLGEIRGWLETNQAAFFASAVDLFKGKEELLQQSLDIPPIETWPVRRPALEVPELPPYDPSKARLVGFEASPHTEASKGAAAAPMRRYPTFRVRRLKPYPFWGAILVAVLAGLTSSALGKSLAIEMTLGLLFAGGVLGFFYAKAHPYDICSDPNCETVMPDGAELCPGCGRPIKGRIRRPGLRLDAEEKILEQGEDWVEM